jgi:hypothetical protein
MRANGLGTQSTLTLSLQRDAHEIRTKGIGRYEVVKSIFDNRVDVAARYQNIARNHKFYGSIRGQLNCSGIVQSEFK